MDANQLIEKATIKVGSIGKLADALGWDKGAIAAIKGGRRPLPAHRAAQLAELLGQDAELAYLTTLKEQAASEFERKILGKLLRGFKGVAASLTIAAALAASSFYMPKADAAVSSKIGGQHTL